MSRRERTGVERRVVFSRHHTRWFLTNGLFVDRSRFDRHPWPYAIYWPGRSESGCALRVGAAGRLDVAISEAMKIKPPPSPPQRPGHRTETTPCLFRVP